MFDVGPSELLLTLIVAVVVIGPKDMPMALRTAGRWIGKFRRMSSHLRTGFDAMIREAELEEMERKWREQNEAVMKAHPNAPAFDGAEYQALPAPVMIDGVVVPEASAHAEPWAIPDDAGSAIPPVPETRPIDPAREAQPHLPLPPA